MPRGFLMVVVCLVCVPAVVADTISLKNGDRVTGKIIKADDKKLLLKTEYAGDLTIALEAVEQIASSDPIYVALADGKTVFGTVMTREGRLVVDTKEGAPVEVERATVAAIRNQTEQADYERRLNPRLTQLWTGTADFSYALTTGNVSNNTIAVGGTATRQTRNDKIGVYGALIYGRTKDDDGVSETTANTVRGGGRYERNLTPRVVAFAFTDLESNEIQLLDLRWVLGGGLGYYFIKNERTQFQVFGGGAYNRENFSTGETRNSAEILVGEELNTQLTDRLTFKERLTFFPNLSETGEYRITFDAALGAKLTQNLTWQFVVSDRFLSTRRLTRSRMICSCPLACALLSGGNNQGGNARDRLD